MAVGEGGEGRDLGDQPDRRHVALLGVVDVLRVRVEGRERADVGEQHPHRVGVVAEALVELLDVLVGEGVVGDVEGPALELRRGRQLAEDQEVGDLEVGRVLAELLDRDAAVLEDPRLAVDVGDRGAAGRGVGEGRVIAHQPEVVVRDLDLAQVHRPDGPVVDLDLVALAGAVVGDAEGVAAGSAVLRRVRLRLLPGTAAWSPSDLLARDCHSYASISRWRCRQTGHWPRVGCRHARRQGKPSSRKQHALRLFAGLPRRYDLAGALLSFGQDPRWRRAMVRQVEAAPRDRVLDVATGTGMVAAALVRRYGCSVVGLDQSPEMLSGARAKLERGPGARGRIELGPGRGRVAALRRR